MSAAFAPSLVLSDEAVAEKLGELASKLGSFDPKDLLPVRVFVPFVRCQRSIQCSYDGERFVHDPIAYAEVLKWHQANYDRWAARDEYWRSKNRAPEYPSVMKSMKYEKDVTGTISVADSFGPYCAILKLDELDAAASGAWQHLCANALGRLPHEDWKPIEEHVRLGAPPIDVGVFASALAKDIEKKVSDAIDRDVRLDRQRALRGLRKGPLAFESAQDTAIFVPLNVFCSPTNPENLVLVEGCTGSTWTSFRAKPPPLPMPLPAQSAAPPTLSTPPTPSASSYANPSNQPPPRAVHRDRYTQSTRQKSVKRAWFRSLFFEMLLALLYSAMLFVFLYQ